MKKNDIDYKILHRSKSIFYILWWIALLIIALVIGYYYLVVLPWIEKNKLDFLIKTEQENRLQQKEDDEEKLEQQAFLLQQEQKSRQNEIYRSECVSLRKENIKKAEDFINSCTRYNTIDFCVASDAWQYFSKLINEKFINDCVEGKK